MKRTLTTLFLFAALTALAQLQPTNPPPRVTLAWDQSPDPEVVSYRLYYGVASRFYTNSIDASATQIQVQLPARGVTYYFAVTAVAGNGLESDFSAEISYTPPVPPAPPAWLMLSDGRRITGTGEPNRAYAVERSTDLSSWEEVAQATADASGRFSAADPNPPGAMGFYRLRAL